MSAWQRRAQPKMAYPVLIIVISELMICNYDEDNVFYLENKENIEKQ